MMTFMIYAADILILLASLVFYRVSQGGGYLVLAVLPLLCVIAPYFMHLRAVAVMLVVNLVFFAFFSAIGMLGVADIGVLMTVLLASSGISYTALTLARTIEKYNTSDIEKEESKYDSIIKELEGVERKGRIVERELARISRLYEITKQLGSVLRFEDLLHTLSDFLEDNFQFEAAHFLMFDKGEFSRGISKVSSETLEQPEASERFIDYKALVGYMRKKEFSPFYLERQDDDELFDSIGINADTFLAFPMFVKDISVILAIEGATKLGYNRFNIIVPQIALELRKVELYGQVEKLSIIDGLTGVYLRRYLMDRLREEVDRAKRLNLTFSIGMIDIDHFKKCNDRYGHLVGDAILKETAKRLRTSIREVDMIARYGGEEFCIVLPETNKDLARAVAERLRKAVVAEKVKAFDEDIKITISAGIATYPKDGENTETLIETADAALYKAKRGGRNKVCAA